MTNDWWRQPDNDESPDWWLTSDNQAVSPDWWNASNANVAGPIRGGLSPIAYDPAAVDYFDRVEAVDATAFDLSGLNATYTEGASGISIPVVLNHLRMMGIS